MDIGWVSLDLGWGLGKDRWIVKGILRRYFRKIVVVVGED